MARIIRMIKKGLINSFYFRIFSFLFWIGLEREKKKRDQRKNKTVFPVYRHGFVPFSEGWMIGNSSCKGYKQTFRSPMNIRKK